MSHTVSGIFKHSVDAQRALDRLEAARFTEDQISMVATDESLGDSFAIEKDNKAAEGGVIGAASGGLLGAIAAGLVATGSLVIPGVNLVVFGTAIAAAAGAGVGATAGGLVGALIGLGVPEYEAKRYEKDVERGSVLLVVDAGSRDRADEVKRIFEQESGEKIAA